MLTALKSPRRWLTLLPLLLALGACGAFVSSGPAQADHKEGHTKGGKGGGGGDGGGGDGGSTAAYTLTDLGGFSGGDFVQSDAFAISDPNAAGVAYVAGDSRMPNGDFHAAVWEVTATGEVLSLAEIEPIEGTLENLATDANRDGIVVGKTMTGTVDEDGNSVFPGFVSIPGHPVVELPSSTGDRHSAAWGINNHGDIVGAQHLWHVEVVDGTVQVSEPVNLLELGDFLALDINDEGVMAGRIFPDDVAAVAWFDQDGVLQVQSLGVLPGQNNSRAYRINEFGEAAGDSFHSGESHLAFYWDGNSLIDLGGRSVTSAADVNNDALVVGWTSGGRTNHAFVWSDGTMFDLNKLVDAGGKAHLQRARGISDSGQIVGFGLFGKNKDYEIRAYLLTPNAP